MAKFLVETEADRLLNFFPGAQAIGADDIDLRFGFVGLAAFSFTPSEWCGCLTGGMFSEKVCLRSHPGWQICR
jgi:hypothetical protein